MRAADSEANKRVGASPNLPPNMGKTTQGESIMKTYHQGQWDMATRMQAVQKGRDEARD